MKLVRLIRIVLLLSLMGAGGASAQQGVTDDTVLIGALGPLTGGTAFIGAPGRDGMQLAVDAINEQGGINGRKLELRFEAALTPAESVAAAKKLVEQDKVFMLVLASGSTGAAAAADYVRGAGVPTYNIFGATPVIREPFANNVFHGAITDPKTSAAALIDRLTRDGRPGQIGLLAGSYAFPQANLAVIGPMLEQQGFDVTVETFDQNAKDFTAQLVSFVRNDVDAVLVLGSFAEAGFAIKQASQVGLADVHWVVDGSAVNNAIVPIIGDADGILGYYNAPFYPGQDAEPMNRYLALWKNAYGKPPQGRPNIYDLTGYGAVYVLAHALDKSGDDLSWPHFIASWEQVSGALPSHFGGYDVVFPETFSATDHQGNDHLGTAVIRNGVWTVLP